MNENNNANSLGKGEVDSSILSGSTTNPRKYWFCLQHDCWHSAVSGRTVCEHDTSTRGKSVDFDRRLFTAKEGL